jgi:hypothetical protein
MDPGESGSHAVRTRTAGTASGQGHRRDRG